MGGYNTVVSRSGGYVGNLPMICCCFFVSYHSIQLPCVGQQGAWGRLLMRFRHVRGASAQANSSPTYPYLRPSPSNLPAVDYVISPATRRCSLTSPGQALMACCVLWWGGEVGCGGINRFNQCPNHKPQLKAANHMFMSKLSAAQHFSLEKRGVYCPGHCRSAWMGEQVGEGGGGGGIKFVQRPWTRTHKANAWTPVHNPSFC